MRLFQWNRYYVDISDDGPACSLIDPSTPGHFWYSELSIFHSNDPTTWPMSMLCGPNYRLDQSWLLHLAGFLPFRNDLSSKPASVESAPQIPTKKWIDQRLTAVHKWLFVVENKCLFHWLVHLVIYVCFFLHEPLYAIDMIMATSPT